MPIQLIVHFVTRLKDFNAHAMYKELPKIGKTTCVQPRNAMFEKKSFKHRLFRLLFVKKKNPKLSTHVLKIKNQ